MKSATKRRLYRGILFAAAIFCALEALAEWFFTIPFRHFYFPAQVARLEWLQVGCFFAAAFLCLVEGYLLFIYRKLVPAARPPR